MDQVLSQIDIFCKVYSNLEFILSFDTSNFVSTLSKYVGRSECLMRIFIGDDQFEWDLLENNNPEEFALIYAHDQCGSTADFVKIEQQIRLQIQAYLYNKYAHVIRFVNNLSQKPPVPNYNRQLEGKLILKSEINSICDLFQDDLAYFPPLDEDRLVEGIGNLEFLELLHGSQAVYAKSISDHVESRVMESQPFDYNELRRSYQRIVQNQVTDVGLVHRQVLEGLGLPYPF